MVSTIVAALVVVVVCVACVWIGRRRDPRIAPMVDDTVDVPSSTEDDRTSSMPYTRGAAPAARILTGRR